MTNWPVVDETKDAFFITFNSQWIMPNDRDGFDWAGSWLLNNGRVSLPPGGDNTLNFYTWVRFSDPRKTRNKYVWRIKATWRGKSRIIRVKGPLTESRLMAAVDGLLMEIEP